MLSVTTELDKYAVWLEPVTQMTTLNILAYPWFVQRFELAPTFIC